MKTMSRIPDYVTNWTDRYFHQSAFDIPVSYPSKRTRKYLDPHKGNRVGPVRLYRGVNIYNKDNRGVTSWTYDRKIAERYAKEMGGKVVERDFSADNILLDTTTLTNADKKRIGYDYEMDDQEVLILEI